MALRERYSGKNLDFFVRMLECPEDYTPEALQAAAQELKERNVTGEALKAIAVELLKDKLLDYFENFSVINDELTLPNSNILSKEEVMPVFIELFEEWKAENDDRIPDNWKYVIGAGFG